MRAYGAYPRGSLDRDAGGEGDGPGGLDECASTSDGGPPALGSPPGVRVAGRGH